MLASPYLWTHLHIAGKNVSFELQMGVISAQFTTKTAVNATHNDERNELNKTLVKMLNFRGSGFEWPLRVSKYSGKMFCY